MPRRGGEVERYESVIAYLESQRRGRPRTFEEISQRVDKSIQASARELRLLVLYGKARVIVLRFNQRDCPFYTVRDDVRLEIIKQGTRF